MQGYRDPFNRAFFDWNSTEQRLRGPLKTLAHLRKGCDAFDGGRLEIVRALATGPKIILLDEPAAGMNPSETAELMTNIRRIRDTFQIAVMLIEHDMKLVMSICEGICVLDHGRIIAKGSPEQIVSDQKVVEAYLGKKKEGGDPA